MLLRRLLLRRLLIVALIDQLVEIQLDDLFLTNGSLSHFRVLFEVLDWWQKLSFDSQLISFHFQRQWLLLSFLLRHDCLDVFELADYPFIFLVVILCVLLDLRLLLDFNDSASILRVLLL